MVNFEAENSAQAARSPYPRARCRANPRDVLVKASGCALDALIGTTVAIGRDAPFVALGVVDHIVPLSAIPEAIVAAVAR